MLGEGEQDRTLVCRISEDQTINGSRERSPFSPPLFIKTWLLSVSSHNAQRTRIMSTFLKNESLLDSFKAPKKIRVNVKQNTEKEIIPTKNIIMLDVSREFLITPSSIKTKLEAMGCQASIAGLNMKLGLGKPFPSSRISAVSSFNKKEGYVLCKDAVLPMSDVAKLSKDELVVYAQQFNQIVKAIDKRDTRLQEIRVLSCNQKKPDVTPKKEDGVRAPRGGLDKTEKVGKESKGNSSRYLNLIVVNLHQMFTFVSCMDYYWIHIQHI